MGWKFNGGSELPTYTGNKTITGTLTVGGQILAVDGTAPLPGYAFSAAPTTGFYRVSATDIGVSIAGVQALDIIKSGGTVQCNANGTLKLTASGSPSIRVTVLGALSFTDADDCLLQRDAANVLALRNSTTAQQFNVYKTYTDAANYERLVLGANADNFGDSNQGVNVIGTMQAGTGSGRELRIGTKGAANLRFITSNSFRWEIDSATGAWQAVANLSTWNGTSALATNATAGFLGVNSCAGPPTGVPASIPTGQIPLVYDSTNNKLYIYNGGWKTLPAIAYA